MSEVEWETPPKQIHKGGKPHPKLLALADALRARPGEWAIIKRDCSVGSVSNYKAGKIAAFPKGEFEFTSRASGPHAKRGTLYGRYIGGAS